jgi:hypothetical protein
VQLTQDTLGESLPIDLRLPFDYAGATQPPQRLRKPL